MVLIVQINVTIHRTPIMLLFLLRVDIADDNVVNISINSEIGV